MAGDYDYNMTRIYQPPPLQIQPVIVPIDVNYAELEMLRLAIDILKHDGLDGFVKNAIGRAKARIKRRKNRANG